MPDTEAGLISAERLKCVLDWVGVSVSDMSPPAVKCLKSVTGCAVALSTKDCSDTRCCVHSTLYVHPAWIYTRVQSMYSCTCTCTCIWS